MLVVSLVNIRCPLSHKVEQFMKTAKTDRKYVLTDTVPSMPQTNFDCVSVCIGLLALDKLK